MTELEVIRREPEGARRDPTLVFVHGICVGAWIWERHALPYFARHGHRAVALSLSGHAGSRHASALDTLSLADFADDIATVVGAFAEPVVVVAHSLGGAAAQTWCLRGGRPAGLVLLASVPPFGLARAALEMAWRHPDLWQALAGLTLGGLAAVNLAVMRRHLFPGGIDDTAFAAFVARAQDESALASAQVMGAQPLAPPPWAAPPTLVIGGDRDPFVPMLELLATAAYYGVGPTVIEGAGHMMMLDEHGLVAARAILDWVRALV